MEDKYLPVYQSKSYGDLTMLHRIQVLHQQEYVDLDKQNFSVPFGANRLTSVSLGSATDFTAEEAGWINQGEHWQDGHFVIANVSCCFDFNLLETNSQIFNNRNIKSIAFANK